MFPSKNPRPQCDAITKLGKQCTNQVTSEKYWHTELWKKVDKTKCMQHQPKDIFK